MPGKHRPKKAGAKKKRVGTPKKKKASGRRSAERSSPVARSQPVQSNPLRHPLDDRLNDLWKRRRTLTDREWTELYGLVRASLDGVRFPQYATLCHDGTSPRELIDIYFNERVFGAVHLTASNSYVHRNSLRMFYARFLIDLIRALEARRRREVPLPIEHDDPETASPLDWMEGDTPEPMFAVGKGLTPKVILASATQFLEAAEERDLLYLARHVCPGDNEKLPMSTLAEEYKIPSYHEHAKKLGITVDRGGITYAAYRDTMLGQWLVSLGITPGKENIDLMQEAFKILCEEALLQYDKRK